MLLVKMAYGYHSAGRTYCSINEADGYNVFKKSACVKLSVKVFFPGRKISPLKPRKIIFFHCFGLLCSLIQQEPERRLLPESEDEKQKSTPNDTGNQRSPEKANARHHKTAMNWQLFTPIVDTYLPHLRTYHDFPEARFAITQGRSHGVVPHVRI